MFELIILTTCGAILYKFPFRPLHRPLNGYRVAK